MNARWTSGDIAPKSGTYNVVAASGKIVGTVKVKKGETLPPTQHQGSHFELCSNC